MKRIAFFTDGWKRLVTYAWNIGIKEAISHYEEHVNVYQFNSFGNWSNSKSFNQGEYNIFNLPDLTEFDGILMDATNVTDDAMLGIITEKIKASKVPAVSLGRQIDGLYYVGIDNATTITTLMSHLYEVHNCRSFIYAGGPDDNSDNLERQKAYMDFLQKKGFSLDVNPAWSSKYTYEAGEAYFEHIMNQQIPLPDAIVCGNDHIATGIIVCAKKYGYEVPRDFIVTGFDNLEQSRFFKPHLTTVEQKREKLGYAGVQILFDLWNHKTPNSQVLVDNTCIFSQSCGCETEDLVDYPYFVKKFVSLKASKIELEEILANYQIELSVAETYEEVYAATQKYIIVQNCDNFAFAIDERFIKGGSLELFPTDHYELENLLIKVCIDKGKSVSIPGVTHFKDFLKNDPIGGIYVFSPIHYDDKCLGVVMIKDGNFLFDNSSYCNMLMYLSQTLIRIYQANALAQENEKLEHLYKHDQLTGVYNRIAFRMEAENFVKKLHEKNISCALAFVDADHFKEINDTFGHDRGDEVLIEIAQTLDKYCSLGSVFRYGGDEFIVLLANIDHAIDKFVSQVHQALSADHISVSIGYVETSPNEKLNIDQYVSEADAKMYEMKRKKNAP